MIINCRDNLYTGDFAPQGFNFMTELKAKRLIDELVKISENYIPKRNCIIIPMSVLNIIERHQDFKHLNLLGLKTSEYLYKVGKVCDIECYLDLAMFTNSIILTWDKESLRDIKLESLLNDFYRDIDHLRIDVLI